MKIFIILACLAVAVSADIKEQWKDFKQTHKKSYRSLIEERLRYQIFSSNLEQIEQHNAEFEQGLTTYKQGVNQFADWTKEEFLAFLKLSGPAEKAKSTEFFKATETAPLTKDWRSAGTVTPVKNQKNCGSCWSFSATGALEGQNHIKNGKLVSLSEQNLIDCSGSYGNEGCNGGLMDSAFEYVQDHGIMTEAAYPYEEAKRKCRFDKSKVVVKCKGHVFIKENSETDLVNAIGTVGPISVAIDATEKLQFYSSGLFNDRTCSKDALNHGVLAVGYGSDNIVVKNSWGPSWGEKGYVRFTRGKNLCGIATMASYPKL